MKASKLERLAIYDSLRKKLQSFTMNDVEDGVMLYCLSSYGCDATHYESVKSHLVADILRESQLPTDLETIVEFFETLLEEDYKYENGIIFTPQYIAEYIANAVFAETKSYDSSLAIIDPSCGCGVFLIAAAEYMAFIFKESIDSIIENNIYGMDVDSDNVRRCILILRLLSAKHGGNYMKINPNIICRDSLRVDWKKEFGVNTFSFIIGNPPYVNPHDINKETVKFLKETFSTTRSGVFNIFYAFIEKAMLYLDEKGTLGYIIPNNFLTIKSAAGLREYLQTYKYVKRILDFGHNMIFKPVRTYNCILLLTAQSLSNFEYCVMPKVDDIESALSKASFHSMAIDGLDKNGWKLVDEKTHRNLRRMESQLVCIKEFIRTGIATLRDAAYLVEHDGDGYYKMIGDEKVYVEDGLVKSIYKVPELKLHDNIDDAKRYIIFPYVKTETGYTLIQEDVFIKQYPKTYNCLALQRKELDSRDKGKRAAKGWYAYGRTQGLNKYGKKLLFPTFTNKPKFVYVEDEDALFCNGYAVFENDRYGLDILQKVLNSYLMEYYISNTSYSIEGGYYCYQKKYVERFSLPWFTEDDINYIRDASKENLDKYLWKLYELE